MSRDYVLQSFRAAVHLQIDYARELNPQQHQAVTAPPGPSLVIAGAGSGKTRTLVYRVAFLLEQGIPPDRLLLLTFTNKAAKEMMHRVADLLGSDITALWGGTFHSIGNRVLRQHANRLGYARDFTILDREDAKDLVSASLGDAGIDVKATRFPKADLLCDIFSLATNKSISVAEILAQDFQQFAHLVGQIEDIRLRYARRKQTGSLMDFDDLLVLWLRLLQEHEDVREHFQRRFQFILVDEYQDTNRLQGDLIDLLAARHQNVMVVGDDSQSIYSWRGANFLNILEFPKRYPAATIYKIETNYRSTPEILELANAAIAANPRQFAKQLAPDRASGQKPAVVVCADANVQARFVAQRALELREEGRSLNRMVVLYRSHFHALELQLELTRRNIPFSITSGIRFFEQAHIKDVAAHVKLVVNPLDEVAFKRLAQLLPGIGAKGAAKLWQQFAAHLPPVPEPGPMSTGDAPATAGVAQPRAGVVAATLQRCAPGVPKKALKDWAQLAITISQLEAPEVRSRPGRMIQLIIDAGYEDHLKAEFANYRSRLEDLEQVAVFAQQFASTEEFLTQLALLTNLEGEEERPAPGDDERLRLSTIHQAKGLEFDVVFVIMLCDGMFPSARSLEETEGEEEERRLFYVAVTRARDELYLSYPLVRATAGCGDFMQQESRFLRELPQARYESWNLRMPSGWS